MKKLIGISLAFCMSVNLLNGVVLKDNAEAANVVKADIDYTESTEYNFNNFDCGYTSTSWINAAPNKIWSVNPTSFTVLLISIEAYSSGANESGIDYDLDEAFFNSLEKSLINAKKNNVTIGIRLRYDANGKTNPEPATFDKVLEHVEQLGNSGLLEKYEDVITYVETGMVGSWGEQWGGKYTSLEYKAELLEKFLDITPDSIAVSVRTPNTVRKWLSMYCGIETTQQNMLCKINDAEYAKKFSRIGLYNDGYMGSDSDLGTYSDRNGETDWLAEAAIYGGEFSGDDGWRMKYENWLPENALPEMYKTNLTYINSNLYKTKNATANFDSKTEAESKISEIQKLYADAGLSAYNTESGISQTDGKYTASWKWIGYDDFIFDEKLDSLCNTECNNSAFYGETVWKFMRSHIGYRYVLRSSEISDKLDRGESLNIKLKVENTGFSESVKDKEAEIILSDGLTNYTFKTDINPKNWQSGKTSDEIINISLPKTISDGKYEVYLRISNLNDNPSDDTLYCTRFANNNLKYNEELAANYIGSFIVNTDKTNVKNEKENKRPNGYYMENQSVKPNENDTVNLLDKRYIYSEDNHYGLTFAFKADGIKSGSEIQLGNWYLAFSSEGTGYSSAYTTYGLNILNLKLSENGTYLLNIPFYSAVFNYPLASVKDSTYISELNFNDSRNYWSADTFTELNGNDFTIKPIGIVESSPEKYSVTYHLPDGDVVYTGNYNITDEKSQTIHNIKADTALSLLKKNFMNKIVKNGVTYVFKGFSTKEDDLGCMIDEDFPAVGNIELYPVYVPDTASTDFNSVKYALTADMIDYQGIAYILDEKNKTAKVGDGSDWRNNSGYYGLNSGNVIIPSIITVNGIDYAVTEISENAFASNCSLKSIIIPNSVAKIGENAFLSRTDVYLYADSRLYGKIKNCNIISMQNSTIIGDVNYDGTVDIADITALKKWLSSGSGNISLYTSDVFKDNVIDIFDLTALRILITRK